ncbi:MAG: hypothetical protein ACRED4_00565, partial [Brevundimonas sp.]
ERPAAAWNLIGVLVAAYPVSLRMTPDKNPSLHRRVAILQGRAEAIKEAILMANRLGERVDPTVSREQALSMFLSNWLEMIHWLDEAAAEAEHEKRLLDVEAAN